ncbi:Prefoldin subunit-domain-containing protein [Aspergillus floccosus]
MGVPNSDLQDLERQRLQLEGNIRKLQESLYHWRTWEAEYDGLIEEVSALDDDATAEELLGTGLELAGSLVNEDEVKTIVGVKEGTTRTKQQVVDLVTRRNDYVKQNVATMEKRLRTEENKLQALNDLEQIPAEPAADYPMTEIVEELDEDGNVISSSIATPGNEASELLDILKKAGVKDIPDAPGADKVTETESAHSAEQSETPTQRVLPETSEHRQTSSPNEAHEESREAREVPVSDVDESPEDAQLRREMIRYGLDEVGAVVAELELDEEASDVSIDDYDDVYDYDEEEEEDEFGRSRTVLDEDYHRQMRELEAKLNARGMWNMGKDTATLPDEVKKELEQPAVVRVERASDSTDKPVEKKKPKKKVAFADDLDIAPPPKPPVSEKKITPVRQSDIPVVSDAVVERSEPADKTTSSSNAPKKTSRFKSTRGASGTALSESSFTPTLSGDKAARKPPTSPSPSSLPLFPAKPQEPRPFSQPISDLSDTQPVHRGPEGKILADTLVEREVSDSAAAPPEPDELDEQLHRKEIASEFYRMRNRVIQQNGGFLEEPEQVPVEPEEGPRRVSKFRAARMSSRNLHRLSVRIWRDDHFFLMIWPS